MILCTALVFPTASPRFTLHLFQHLLFSCSSWKTEFLCPNNLNSSHPFFTDGAVFCWQHFSLLWTTFITIFSFAMLCAAFGCCSNRPRRLVNVLVCLTANTGFCSLGFYQNLSDFGLLFRFHRFSNLWAASSLSKALSLSSMSLITPCTTYKVISASKLRWKKSQFAI